MIALSRARTRWIAAGALLLLLVAGGALLSFGGGDDNAGRGGRLAVMTSLPIVWGEGGVEEVVEGSSEPAPAYRALAARYDMLPLDTLSEDALAEADLLLLAQPRALTPAELVAVDAWLRAGGRALILADPALVWPADRPLGDPRRPVFTSLLSPLLAHWGLELVLPMDQPRETVKVTVAGHSVETALAGELRPLDDTDADAEDEDASCTIGRDGFRADCVVGKGRAILLADADFLHPRFTREAGWLARMTGGSADGGEALADQLRELGSAAP